MSADETCYASEATGCFGSKGPCEICIRIRSERERFWRAAKAWGIGWGIMVVSAFVPIAHWILVPSFLLIGPLLGFSAYGQDRVVTRGSGKCPECHNELTVTPGSYKDELWAHCAHCRAYVNIAVPSGQPST
jgi:hypothetical protein